MGIREVINFLDRNKGKYFSSKQIIKALKGKVNRDKVYKALKQITHMKEYEVMLANVDRKSRYSSEHEQGVLITLYRSKKGRK